MEIIIPFVCTLHAELNIPMKVLQVHLKCRTQCAARSEETPALAAVESTWHRSHI